MIVRMEIRPVRVTVVDVGTHVVDLPVVTETSHYLMDCNLIRPTVVCWTLFGEHLSSGIAARWAVTFNARNEASVEIPNSFYCSELGIVLPEETKSSIVDLYSQLKKALDTEKLPAVKTWNLTAAEAEREGGS